MCACLPSSPISVSVTNISELALSTRPIAKSFHSSNPWKKLYNATRNDISFLCIRSVGSIYKTKVLGSENYHGFTGDEDEEDYFDFETPRRQEKQISSEFLELKGGVVDEKEIGKRKVKLEDENGDGEEKLTMASGRFGIKNGRQVIRRSNLLAKQVISIRNALALGFVSQLWVDTTSWIVLFVEVRPSLLSGESERFLFEDVRQVGDVVLVEDETVIENEFKMVGLETLVGYKVVTPDRQNIGKVRGYTFNINSGAIESLELDSYGISIIPSSLVSTYALLVEDVLGVLSDAVVVHEAAATRIHRLTKGY
ncbi:uncharacterized protein LOC133777438 isoform X2 [Humulus lupulus]|uniref:uncharacterized protein LOC133777438 isoform X2 n=1 Tax=Humulus lupulus TaxID=3486 RepID=UPI002B41628D|nr:uncharacterized protein LOC133777438 isoform X2 [Humulus lupulus]